MSENVRCYIWTERQSFIATKACDTIMSHTAARPKWSVCTEVTALLLFVNVHPSACVNKATMTQPEQQSWNLGRKNTSAKVPRRVCIGIINYFNYSIIKLGFTGWFLYSYTQQVKIKINIYLNKCWNINIIVYII